MHEADAFEFDFATLAADAKLRVVGNLPYNISTPPSCFASASLRTASATRPSCCRRKWWTAWPRGSGERGRLSVMLQYRYRARISFIDVATPVRSARFRRWIVASCASRQFGTKGCAKDRKLKLPNHRRVHTTPQDDPQSLAAWVNADTWTVGIEPTARAEDLSTAGNSSRSAIGVKSRSLEKRSASRHLFIEPMFWKQALRRIDTETRTRFASPRYEQSPSDAPKANFE